MAAGAAAGDAEAIRVHAPPARVEADETHGAMDVFGDLGDGELRLAAMDHGEDGVAPVEKGRVTLGADSIMGGDPSPADHIDDAAPIGWDGGLENVEGEGHAELAAIHDILSAGVSGVRLPRGARQRGRQERQEEKAGERDHGCGGHMSRLSVHPVKTNAKFSGAPRASGT